KQLAEMLSVAMSEPVPEEYGDIVASSLGLDPPAAPPAKPGKPLRAIIIGGGISGICAAMELGNLGIAYHLYEKNSDF
ncbi:NAD(P)-binding protein, partial [Escherichia coli]|uniref:NAD(P)-binding protein n=2 Tax=Pseudomonadota TaxID=1224 RepID=UPI003D02EE02